MDFNSGNQRCRWTAGIALRVAFGTMKIKKHRSAVAVFFCYYLAVIKLVLLQLPF